MNKQFGYGLIVSVLSAFSTTVQSSSNIPAPSNSGFIFEFNLPFIFSQTSIDRLNMSEVGTQVYEELFVKNRNYEKDFKINQSGVDHSQKAYIHVINSDSISYTVRLLPLKDVGQFKKTIGIESNTKSLQKNGGTFYTLKFKEQVYIPNSNAFAIVVSYSSTYSAFNDSARAARWGMEDESSSSYYDDNDPDIAATEYLTDSTATLVEAYDKAEDAIVEGAAAVDVAIAGAIKEGSNDDTEDAYVIAPPMAIYDEPAPSTYTYDNEKYKLYQATKDSIFSIWTAQFIEQMIQNNKSTSTQLSQLKDLDANSSNTAVSFYMNNYAFNWQDIYRSFGIGRSSMSQIGKFNATDTWTMLQLNFEPNAVKMKAISRATDNLAKSSKRIYNRKLNKKFNNYINSASDIGVATMAFNTKNYLEASPNMVKEMLNIYGLWEDEGNLFADLFALVVDEKATGKLIWGDGAFVMTNVKEKEYERIAYDWDEETFKSTERIEKAKEVLPNFLMMFTTKDVPMVKKILDYGVKKKAYKEENGIYYANKLASSYDPFEYFCTIHNGIVFFSTEKDVLVTIMNGEKRGNLSASDKKIIRNKAAGGWFHTKRLVGKIYNENDKDSNLRNIRLNNMLNSFGPIWFNASKMKGNKAYADFVIETPNSKSNAFEYLLLLIDDLKNF